MKFEDMKFSDKLHKAIKEMNYETPTEVQEQSIPLVIEGHNLICKSFTGSGKTAAFGIGISERLLNGKSHGVLIIGPTRELVVQVKEEVHKINRYSGLKVSVVYGGHGMMPEVQALRKGVDILCATPGRLLDHIKQGIIKRDFFDTVVLDEADRMLDMGFVEDLNKIMEFFKPKNTLLFSATLEQEIVKLIHKYIPNYKEVMIKTEIVGENIIEKKIEMRPQDKFLYLLEIVKKAEGKRVLVFVSTKREAENVERKLAKSGFFASSIHGDKSQKFREMALKDFKSGKVSIMVATDVAARGLQIDNVEFVVNYDIARDKDTHKHRIGRTGRMGATGYAITFMTGEEMFRDDRKRGGRRPTRSQHSIDSNTTNIWDQTRRPRSFERNRFGADRSSNSRAGRSEFRKSFDAEKPATEHSEAPVKHVHEHTAEQIEKTTFKIEPRVENKVEHKSEHHVEQVKEHREPKAENVMIHLEKHKIEFVEPKDDHKVEHIKEHRTEVQKAEVHEKYKLEHHVEHTAESTETERPKRSFEDRSRRDSEDRGPPRRSFDDKPRFGSRDGPRRDFGDRGPPRRSFGDKPRFGSRDGPRSESGDSDRPRRSFGDKPRFGSRDGPRRDSGDRGPPRRSFGDKPRFGSRDGPRDGPRKSFGDDDKPKFGRDRPRRDFGNRDGPKFGRDRPRVGQSKFDSSDKSTGFEKRTYQAGGDRDKERKPSSKEAKGPFVPKSFRRDKDYMSSRPEYSGDKTKKADSTKKKEPHRNVKTGKNAKFQGRFPRKI